METYKIVKMDDEEVVESYEINKAQYFQAVAAHRRASQRSGNAITY